MKNRLFLIALLLFFVGCKKDSSSVKLHYEYFGVNKGRFVIYDVNEITHLSNGSKEYSDYQLKTVIGDTVHDNSGRLGYKFLRYKRLTSTDNWAIKDVWFIIIADNKGELIEENERIIKLVFAPTSKKTWNGNAYNTKEEVVYSYDSIHKPYKINGLQLDSTLKVVQEDVFNMIQFKKKHEIYAKNIGLVKKHYQDLNISNFDINNVSTGKEIFYNMTSYGVE